MTMTTKPGNDNEQLTPLDPRWTALGIITIFVLGFLVGVLLYKAT